uniref:Uncharacterized protein n=1 Tax=Plectus sambesii TaxID=2011161 RepID=A0A914VHA6_9BILA
MVICCVLPVLTLSSVLRSKREADQVIPDAFSSSEPEDPIKETTMQILDIAENDDADSAKYTTGSESSQNGEESGYYQRDAEEISSGNSTTFVDEPEFIKIHIKENCNPFMTHAGENQTTIGPGLGC